MSLKLTLRNLPHTFNCDKCSEVFKSNLHLKYHKFRVHNRFKPYVCKLCFRSFRRIGQLQQHSRKHKNDSALMCSVCDETFVSRSILNVHKGTHVHYEGDHECCYCSASFLYLAEARLHVLLVHGDSTVLPPERPKRSASVVDDMFCIKKGQGLKLKLSKLNSDDEQYAYMGSQASDSGKGNSDMDDEDLRYTNSLVRRPTFVPKPVDSLQRPPSHKLNLDSGLLMRPKLELGQRQWGSSKIQPTLTSKDFLTKTKFATSAWGQTTSQSMLGLSSPARSLSAMSASPTNSLSGSMDNKAFLSGMNANGSTAPHQMHPSPLAQSSLFTVNKPQLSSSFPGLSNGLFNGSLFKAPSFPSAKFSTIKPGGFGAQSGFGSNIVVSSSSSLAGSLSFQVSKPTFMMSKAMGFGGSGFGSSPFLAPTLPSSTKAFISVPAPFIPPMKPRNGEILHEPIFGTKKKMRSVIAKQGDDEDDAFARYAGSAGVSANSNPFAEAMKRAKNPLPRRSYSSDSDYTGDSSSFYSSDGDSDASWHSGSSEEDKEISDIDDHEVPLPQLPGASVAAPAPDVMKSTASGSASVHSVLDQPLQWMPPPLLPSMVSNQPHMPLASSITPSRPLSPQIPPSPSPPAVTTELPVIPSPEAPAVPVTVGNKANAPLVNGDVNHVSKSPHYKVSSSISKPPSVSALIEEETVNESQLKRPRRRTSSNRSPIRSEQPQLNGTISPPQHAQRSITDLPAPSSTEVSGNIDLDTPSLSISIPRKLLMQATGTDRTRRGRRASGKTIRRTSASKTPTRSASATPNYGGKTPSYPAIQDYASQPPTPQPPLVPDKTATASPSPHVRPVNKRAPTKQEMMERMRKAREMKQKSEVKVVKKRSLIGPKSYQMRVNGRVFSDAEDDLPNDMFRKSELLPTSSGRTDRYAPYLSRFKHNQIFLTYLRQRALDLIICLFPNTRIGGNFCPQTDDVEGLLDYITMSLENKDSSRRCMTSRSCKRKTLNVVIELTTKQAVKMLQTKICRLIRLVLPSLSMAALEKEGVNTLPKLIHKVIAENT